MPAATNPSNSRLRHIHGFCTTQGKDPEDRHSNWRKAAAGLLTGIFMVASLLGTPGSAEALSFAGLFDRSAPGTLEMQVGSWSLDVQSCGRMLWQSRDDPCCPGMAVLKDLS